MVIEKIIETDAPDWAFWSALCCKGYQLERGGYYACNWVTNSSINWIASDGIQSHGKLLQIKEMQYLSYLRFDNEKRNQVVALVSYQIKKLGENSIVKVSTDLIKHCGAIEIHVQKMWLDKHLLKLINLAQKIKLQHMNVQHIA